MTTLGRRFAKAAQPALFDLTDPSRALKPTAGSLGMGAQVRECLCEALKASPLSRCQIAEGMSELTGAEVSKTRLDLWTAPGKTHRFPIEYAAAFMYVTESRDLLTLQAKPLGLHVIDSAERVLLELARVELAKRDLAKKERDLKAILGRVKSSGKGQR